MNINFLPDLPIEDTQYDHLGFVKFISLLRLSFSSTQTPFVFGVLGSWGSGKTSILKILKSLMEHDLEKGATTAIPIWFSAWQYENETHLLYPLLNAVKRDYMARLAVQNLSKEFGQRFIEIAAASTLALADISLRAVTKAMIGDAVKLEDIKKQIQAVKDHSSEIEKALSVWTDEVEILKTGFKELLKTYAKEYPFSKPGAVAEDARFVILIDDLDRCLPETVIGILEKIKNFLAVEDSPCIFVLALNPKVVYQGIRVKYHGLEIDGREYLEKIINYSFYVPEPDDKYIEKYCRESLDRLVGNADRKNYSLYFNKFGKIMVDCHFSNPRKIKRILNHYLFFLNLFEKNIEVDWLPNIIRFIILAEYYPNIFELFLENIETAREQMGMLGMPNFNVKAFEDQFGVQISGNANQLRQMKSLFELTGPDEDLLTQAHDVFSIVRSS